MQQKLKTIDLFAGIGGIRLGFEENDFETVFANDFDKDCKTTYDENYAEVNLTVEDIHRVVSKDLPKYDLLLGGFPCQAFSIAGYRQGFNDKKGRGNLFLQIARILDETKPIGFLLENVKNLEGHDEGRTFKIIGDTLKKLGYKIKFEVLNSMKYGNVPQTRERIYIVGFKSKRLLDKFEFPKPIPLKVTVADLLETDVDKKYYYEDKPLFEKLKNYEIKKGSVYQWRRKYIRENKKGVCPTLTANMGMGGHNVPIIRDHIGIRKMTPRECARMQGFPDRFILPKTLPDSKLYKQLGNSVTVSVIKRIAKNMQKVLTKHVFTKSEQH